ncbi:MAG: 5-oxoprolinase subunit B family protein [Isosphaeraceae bacterium]
MPMPRDPSAIEPLGDRAFLTHFDARPPAAAWAAQIRRRNWPGVTDVVLAYDTVAVFADPDQLDPAELEERLRSLTLELDPHAAAEPVDPVAGKTLVIPVLYDGADLERVAADRGLDVGAVIALHAGVVYDVLAIGFLPGFPYAGDLPPALAGLPRRPSPRPRVPAGSVAIAGRQTCVYPAASPGGWHLLGRTPLCIADPADGFFPIRAGNRIRFRPIAAEDYETRLHERLRIDE